MKFYSFLKGLSWLILLNLLIKPVWIFFIDRQVQNIVGYQAYGKYFAIFNLTFVLLFIADGGISNMVNQRMAAKLPVNLPGVFRVKGILLGIYILACCLAAWISGISQWILVFYLVGVQALTSVFVFLRAIITANQLFTADAILSVLDKFLMILLCGGFIYGVLGKINLVIFLQVQTVSTAVSISVALILIYRNKLLGRKDGEKMIAFSGSMLPFALIILLMSLHYRLDGFLLERLHNNGSYEAGVYASGYRLLDAANMVGYLSASFLVPFIARQQFNIELVSQTVLTLRQVLLVFAGIIVSFTWVFAPLIQQLLYHSADAYNSMILRLSLAALPGYYLVHVYGSVLTATAQFRPFIVILIYSVVINTVLNLVLIPGYGAYGCCIAAITSQLFCGITLLISTSGRVKIGVNFPSLVFTVILVLLLFILFLYTSSHITNVWIILALLAGGTLVGVAGQYLYSRKKYSLIL